jgi:hypothetical protein
VDVSKHADLPLIDPDAVTLGARIDSHILEGTLLQVTATLRTLHEMLTTRDLATLLVEERAHLSNQLRILTRKVLVFIAGGMVLGVTMHESSGPSVS